MKRWLRRNAPEIIVATLCIAFFGFVAIPNLWRAKQRSAQKRTMAGMRTIATAWEARATDMNTYAVTAAESTAACQGNCGVNRGHVTLQELQRALVPKYMKRLPLADGWGIRGD